MLKKPATENNQSLDYIHSSLSRPADCLSLVRKVVDGRPPKEFEKLSISDSRNLNANPKEESESKEFYLAEIKGSTWQINEFDNNFKEEEKVEIVRKENMYSIRRVIEVESVSSLFEDKKERSR